MATAYITDKAIAAYERLIKTGRFPKDINNPDEREWLMILGDVGDKLRDVTVDSALKKLEKLGYIEIEEIA